MSTFDDCQERVRLQVLPDGRNVSRTLTGWYPCEAALGRVIEVGTPIRVELLDESVVACDFLTAAAVVPNDFGLVYQVAGHTVFSPLYL